MRAHLRQLIATLGETFWLLPGLMTLLGIGGAVGLLSVDRGMTLPDWLIGNPWVYNGGGTGARTLLGAIAASTIGVAGTVFSITVAALSLAAGQMGPRLLRNFTRDRGVQFALGAFVGTFSYALMVLRSVRTQEEGLFTPHLALTVGILLAFVCVATLIYFVGHMAGRINVDTVIDLVSDDVHTAIHTLTSDTPSPVPRVVALHAETPVIDPRRGYLQHLDAAALADWAASNATALRMLVRPGDYVFPGTPIALLSVPVEGAIEAVRDATALGANRASSVDIEFAVRQLVEVAVRALSPGINDPHTAISVLNRLGAALCDVAPRYLPIGRHERGGRVVLVVPHVDYDGLTDAMFHMIRQNAGRSVPVLARILEVILAVTSCERDPQRRKALRRHADLVLADADRTIETPSDLLDLRERHADLVRALHAELPLPVSLRR